MPQILGKEIGAIGYGLMGLTWRPEPCSQEQAFKAMKKSLEMGANFWNGGEFYGTPSYNSMTLLKAYFTKYPEDAEKVILSIKGGINLSKYQPDGTPEGIAKSINNCMEQLGGTKKIDLFECARVDRKTPIETTMKALEEHVKKGDIGGICLSECSAATVEAAAKVTKIWGVEVEFSLWSLDVLSNGVAAACAKNGIPLIAYSPIGRGMLTGEIKSHDDLADNDMRKGYPRFSKENFPKNLQLVTDLQKIAKKKGCSTAQLAIAWVKQQSGKDGNPEIIPIPGATTASRVEENSTDITLSEAELADIKKVLDSFKVVGHRYPEASQAALEG